jgi:hypothetical protein
MEIYEEDVNNNKEISFEGQATRKDLQFLLATFQSLLVYWTRLLKKTMKAI